MSKRVEIPSGVDEAFARNAIEERQRKGELAALRKKLEYDSVERVRLYDSAVADATLSKEALAEVIHRAVERNSFDTFIQRAEKLVADLRRAKQYSEPNPHRQEYEESMTKITQRLQEIERWFETFENASQAKKAKTSSTFVQE